MFKTNQKSFNYISKQNIFSLQVILISQQRSISKFVNYNIEMSSYIIAGSADSIDTAYCQEIARRIKSKYKNIDFRIVIKHPSQWEQYLQQICRIYGFLKKSNPIIYTFDGKIIGNKQAFMSATAKYFGLDQQSLNVQNLTNQVNMKIATQQINRKHINKHNIKTLTQKIESRYQELLKKNILKYELKEKKIYLTRGIEYIHRSVKGIVTNISFIKNKDIPVQIQQVVASDIDLMVISLNDQIKVDQQPLATTVAATGKQAFVTANQKNNSQHDKMSEASKTNKMHQSVVSYDKDSKQMKDSSKSKLRIDQQNEDVPDYVDLSMQQALVSQLADHFYVGFSKNSHITGQMIFYYSDDGDGSSLRLHNDNRPVKGHRVLIKQIHFDGQNALLEENSSQIIQNQQLSSQNRIQYNQQGAKLSQQNIPQNESIKQDNIQPSNEISANLLKPKPQKQKIRTEPNIPNIQATSTNNIPNNDEIFSQIHSDLNLISHLNYHTLYILKPLSLIQIKNLLYFINQTNCIGCLQFLGQNPNPKVKLYHRKFLLQTQNDDYYSLSLPVEKFIQKQLQDNQYTKLYVPNQNCYDYEQIQNQEKFQLLQINDIGFQHYIYLLDQNSSSQTITKALKHTIDSMLSLQEQLKKDIGYNVVFTKKYVIIIPLSEPYEIYNQTKLFLDGLAYLGFVHTADLIKSYQVKNQKISHLGNHLRKILSKSSNSKEQN